MKIQKLIFSISVGALLLWNAGCKQESKPDAEPAAEAAPSTAEVVAKTTDSARETGTEVVQETTAKVNEVAAPASAKAQELIDSAKGLLAEGKFQDALAKLKEIGGEKLSLNQQSMVDSLKAQIEKALAATPRTAADAAGSVGNLLNKK